MALSVLPPKASKDLNTAIQKVAAAMWERPISEAKGVQVVIYSLKTSKSKVALANVVTDGSLIDEIDKSCYIAELDGK